jgi:tripartite-type tricarboxylate transporter receptor subunit TctC
MSKWINRRLALLAATGLVLACQGVAAQTSGQPVRILAGYAPGGNVDILARTFAKALSEATGRTVIVENKPGGGGQVAAEMLKAAAPDGNTLMMAPDAAAVVRPAAMKKPTFDPTRDFTAVAETGAQDYGFAVPASLPVKDLKEFAAWARANAKEANYGSAGMGGITHMASILIGRTLDVSLQHVPFNGSAPAVTALAAGHIAATFQPTGTLAAQVQAGKIKVLAVSGTRRSELFPNVPTFTEQGHPGVQVVTWFGLFAPARTPPEIVAQYHAAVLNAMRQPAIRSQMKTMGLEMREFTPTQFSAQVKQDMDRWTSVVKAAGISLDE